MAMQAQPLHLRAAKVVKDRREPLTGKGGQACIPLRCVCLRPSRMLARRASAVCVLSETRSSPAKARQHMYKT